MRWITILAFVALSSAVSAKEAATQLLSSDFLGTYNWKDAEPIERASRDWQNFSGNQSGDRGIKDRTILKTKSVSIAGLKFDGSLRRYNKSGEYEVLFISSLDDEKPSLNYCNGLMTEYTSAFGAPKNLVDISDDMSQTFATIDKKAYWDLDQTRLLVNCAGTKVYNSFIPIVSVVLGHKSNVGEVYDAVFLKCSRKKIGLGNSSMKAATEEPPITLIIDQNMKQLRSRTANLGKTTSYGERKIVSVLNDKKKEIEGQFVLDRYSGSYVWELRIVSNDKLKNSGIRFWGDCEKVQDKKKF